MAKKPETKQFIKWAGRDAPTTITLDIEDIKGMDVTELRRRQAELVKERMAVLNSLGFYKGEREMFGKYEFDVDYFDQFLWDRHVALRAGLRAGYSKRWSLIRFYKKIGALPRSAHDTEFFKAHPNVDPKTTVETKKRKIQITDSVAGRAFDHYRKSWIADHPEVNPSPRKPEHETGIIQARALNAAFRQKVRKYERALKPKSQIIRKLPFIKIGS
jgi:hypothetical protein